MKNKTLTSSKMQAHETGICCCLRWLRESVVGDTKKTFSEVKEGKCVSLNIFICELIKNVAAI